MKKSIFLLLSFLTAFCFAGPLKIVAVKNNSGEKIYLNSRIIKGAQSVLSPSLDIPMISALKRYRTQWLENKPYFPKEAIKITFETGDSVFGIWQEERGIVGARQKTDAFFDDKAVPYVLFKKNPKDIKLKDSRFMLIVDANGDVSVQSTQ